MRRPESSDVSFDRLGDAIDRGRLLDSLDEGASARLTSIVAPAGWGKSVLLASWARRTDHLAWIDLTRTDNDAGQLIRTLYTGLTPLLDEATRRSAGHIDHLTAAAAPPRAEEVAQGLESQVDLSVILDDVHILVDPVAIESLQRFVEAIPAGVRLITAARHDPPFPVARLRVAGELAEIRQRDLAFTADELAELLEAEGIELDSAAAASLMARTEGWAAAIRLAIIAMRRSSDPTRVVENLAGSNRVVSEYLIEEVLSEIDEPTRDFLLSTSIVDEINGPLAAILTRRPDGEEILNALADAGAFTSRTTEPGWFRYHHLLRSFLELHLRSRDEESYLGLHRTAARWFDSNGLPVPAIEHALAAGEIELATTWIEAAVTPLVNAGRGQTLADLAKRLSEATAEPPLPVVLARMFALYSIGSDPDAIDQLLDVLIAAAEADRPLPTEGGDPRSMIDPLPWLIGLKARMHGDLPTILDLDRPDNLPSPSGRVEAWIAEAALWDEQFERADELLVTYRRHAEQDQDIYPPSMLHALGLTAYSLVAQGRLAEADRVTARARALIERIRSGHLVHTLYAQLAEAGAMWERGHLPDAEASLVRIQEHADHFGDVPVSAMLSMQRARNRWSLGDGTGAPAVLDAAEVMPSGRVIGGHFARRINLERCRLDILTGHHDAAALRLPDRAALVDSPTEPLRDRIAAARVLVALGEDHPVIHQLVEVEGTTISQRIDLTLLRAARAHARGDNSAAAAALAEGMRVAGDAGMTQRVVDERALFARSYTLAVARTGFLANETGSEAPTLIDPLTDRELEVLANLSTQMTYQEIADELFVSQNTVKSHTAAIYRKLAVARRTDAVNRARTLGLI